MPALPRILRSIPDTRIINARQPETNAGPATRVIERSIQRLLEPIPTLSRRQNGGVLAIPTQYQGLNAGPAPGTVAGIVLGSIAGFLFLLWLLWVLSNGSGFIRSSTLIEEDVVVQRRQSRSRGGGGGTRKSRRTEEMVSRSPRRERVIRQERIIREGGPPRESSRIRETILVDEESLGPRPPRRVDGDDIVEVIEEHSSVDVPPPRRKSRRSSAGYR